MTVSAGAAWTVRGHHRAGAGRRRHRARGRAAAGDHRSAGTAELRAEYRVEAPDRTKIARDAVLAATDTEVTLASGSYASGLRPGHVIVSGATPAVPTVFAARVDVVLQTDGTARRSRPWSKCRWCSPCRAWSSSSSTCRSRARTSRSSRDRRVSTARCGPRCRASGPCGPTGPTGWASQRMRAHHHHVRGGLVRNLMYRLNHVAQHSSGLDLQSSGTHPFTHALDIGFGALESLLLPAWVKVHHRSDAGIAIHPHRHRRHDVEQNQARARGSSQSDCCAQSQGATGSAVYRYQDRLDVLQTFAARLHQ